MANFFKAKDLGIGIDKGKTRSKKSLANSFEPIGIGKPLVIRLHTVYLGELKTNFLNDKRDIIVTSLIKDDVTFESPARGVHQIFSKKKEGDLLFPTASNEGTELIYYTPAFDQGRILFDLEVKADNFKESVYEDIANGLSLAGGLPVFTPFAPYMMAGSQLLKVASTLVNKANEKVPLLSYHFDISQDIGGLTDAESGFFIGGNFDDLRLLNKYKVTQTKGQNHFYLSWNNKPYDGPKPYVIISVDGRSAPRYENFKATIASAALLKKFFGINQNTDVKEVQKILQVYNDFNYLQKIKRAKDLIELSKDENKNKEYEVLISAYEANIVNKDIFDFDR